MHVLHLKEGDDPVLKKFLTISILCLSVTTQAGIEVIYGKDNRLDVYQTPSALHKRLALSTAAMVPANFFVKSAVQGSFDLANVPTLERGQNICPSETFSQQPIAATCSGFLVGPDTLVTAGHCFKAFSTPEQVCKSFAWVFELDLKSSVANPLSNIPLKNIYLCKEVVAAELSQTVDFAVIKLDRVVVGREPLKFRTKGKISNNASLVVIGHPTGLPTKISAGGKVTKNDDPTRFSTTLDTFHGNSGSAVFDAATGVIEGLLIQGKTDYIPSKKDDATSCKVVNRCDDNGSNCLSGPDQGQVQWGEVVLRVQEVIPSINKALGHLSK
jgi:V8-like Glu-specific endopeptidase